MQAAPGGSHTLEAGKAFEDLPYLKIKLRSEQMGSVHTEVSDGAMVIRWSNPAAKNALNLAMYRQLDEALKQAQQSDAIKACVLLGGQGDFCSGNDLAEFIQAQGLTGAEFFNRCWRLFAPWLALTNHSLAAVEGWVVGIGATLYCIAIA